jgi:ABC-type nitrate/sulfonate/bicarbonate transport system ATPase subunit
MVLVTHNIEEAVFWGSQILVLGKAPNTEPVIVENAGSGSFEYRNSPDFMARCKQLRGLVENKARNGRFGDRL